MNGLMHRKRERLFDHAITLLCAYTGGLGEELPLSYPSQFGQQECLDIGRHREASDNVWPKDDWRRGEQLFR
jgi:hypothetical protein